MFLLSSPLRKVCPPRVPALKTFSGQCCVLLCSKLTGASTFTLCDSYSAAPQVGSSPGQVLLTLCMKIQCILGAPHIPCSCLHALPCSPHVKLTSSSSKTYTSEPGLGAAALQGDDQTCRDHAVCCAVVHEHAAIMQPMMQHMSA